MIYDHLVIGGGIAGMTCAILLAKAGRKVILIEKASRLGPVFRGFKKKGHYFDTGFHYCGALGKGEIFESALSTLGVYPLLQPICYDAEGFDLFHYLNEKTRLPLSFGWERLTAQLSQHFPEDVAFIERYFRDCRHIYEAIQVWLSEPNSTINPEGNANFHESLQEYMDRGTSNTALKSLLTAHSVLYGTAPEHQPFTTHAQIMGTYYQSVWGVKGGGSAIVEAFTQVLKSVGVEVRCGVEVTTLTGSSESQHLTQATLSDGSVIASDSFIATCHPLHLNRIVDPAFMPPMFRKRLNGFTDTHSAFILYGICRNAPDWFVRHNHLVITSEEHPLCSDYSQTQSGFFIATDKESTQGNDVAFSCIFPSAFSKCKEWEATTYRNRPEAYTAYKQQTATTLTDVLRKSFPALADTIEILEVATPLTLQHYAQAPNGCLYGISRRTNEFQPQSQTRIPNLHLAGQSVMVPGFTGAVFSGFFTTRLLGVIPQKSPTV
jgi:all-trans-retinol 13,14-reductase